MLGKISKVRHATVVAAVGGTTVLGATGVIGGGNHPERFDAKTIVVQPAGPAGRSVAGGVRITEYVDVDFGTNDRHGYERQVPNDFGVPEQVTASSPDANATAAVQDFVEYSRIRLGSPAESFSGQHRYVLEYVLPDAQFDTLGLSLDLVSPPGGVYPGDHETGRFEVIVTGFDLSATTCDVGGLGAEGGCDLVESATEPGVYRVVLEPLGENLGLTIGGDVEGFVDPIAIDPPPLPERRSGPNQGLIAAGMAGLGAAGAVPVYRWARRRGSNEVFAGGAADAAYGDVAAPGQRVDPPPPVRLVADDELGDLATIEFVPPKGLEPWQALVLLTERVDDDAVEAYLSGLAGREAIELDEDDDDLVIRSGDRRVELAADDTRLLDGILDLDDPYVTGTYDKKFAKAWTAIHDHQVSEIAASGWWKHMPPGSGLSPKRSGSPFGLIVFGVFTFFWFGSAASAFLGMFRSLPVALLLGLVFPAIVSYVVYRALLPARSAPGSALALRTESFRRFLHASEGHHVEWAWDQGMLREYSAWAVALGEADAWSKALANAKVPAAAAAASGPIILHDHGSSMRTSRTAPSSSGSGGGGGRFGGGGGGFGGGGVGGGGGGGSSGSW